MTNVLEQLNSLMSVGRGGPDIEKTAGLLAQRHTELADASNEEFALVIYDGERMHRKFPVQTEDDIKLSRNILDKIADRLPSEVEMTARFFIDLASRERLKKPAYDFPVMKVASNVVYAGHINNRAWGEKMASLDAHSDTMIAGYRVESAHHVRRLEYALGSLGLDPMDEAEAGVKLAMRAAELGVSLRDQKVARFARTNIPANFAAQVEYRKSLAPEVLSPYFEDLLKEAAVADSAEKLLGIAKCVEYLDLYASFTPAYGESRAFSKLGSETPGPVGLVFPIEQDAVPTALNMEPVTRFFGEKFAAAYAENPDTAMGSLSPSERQALMALTT
jgi:hypothetical protein